MADTNWADYWAGLGKTQDDSNSGSSGDPDTWVAPTSSQSTALSGAPSAGATTPTSAFATGDWTDSQTSGIGSTPLWDQTTTRGATGLPAVSRGGVGPSSAPPPTGDFNYGAQFQLSATPSRATGLPAASRGGITPSGTIGTDNLGSPLGRPGLATAPSPATGLVPGNIAGSPSYNPPNASGRANILGGGGGSPPAGTPVGDTPTATTPSSTTLTGNNVYWNPYTQQYQNTPPVNTNPTGLATVDNSKFGGYTPTYQTGNQVTGPGANGTGLTTGAQNLNPQYYATYDSAVRFAKILGLDASSVFMNDNGYSPGGTAAAGSTFSFPGAYMIRLPDGRVINAGQESQPWANGSANADTVRNILQGGATLEQQEALMPLSPSIRPGDYQQTGGPGNPISYTPQALASQAAYLAANPPAGATATTPAATTAQPTALASQQQAQLDPNLLAFLNLFSQQQNTGSGNQLLDYLLSLTGGNTTQNNSLNSLSAIFDQLMGSSDLYQRRRQYPSFA